MKSLLLLDLDRTLFDTDRFFEEAWRSIEQAYDTDVGSPKRGAPDYFTYFGKLYDYDFFRHVRAVTGTQDSEEQIRNNIVKTNQGVNFLYDDVTDELIAMIDAIVTFGNEPWQMTKLALCPSLNGIELHVIQEQKPGYIAKTFAGPTVLVDDKDIAADMIPPHRLIRIDRDGSTEGATTTSVRNMHEVIDIIRDGNY